MVAQLREDRLNPLSETLICPRRRSPIFSVQSIGNFKSYGGSLKEILLYGRTEIALISEYHTVMVFPPDILQVKDIRHIGGRHVKRVYDTGNTTQSVKFITIVVHVLRSTISPCRGMHGVGSAHCTSACTRILANLYRLGIYAENRLSSINCHGKGLADFLSKSLCQLTALVELASGYQVGNGTRTFPIKPLEKIVLTINTKGLRSYRKRDHLYVGEFRNDTTTGNISIIIYMISCKMFADVKNFTELC